MNMIMKAMAGLARGFLAYVDETNNAKEFGHDHAGETPLIPSCNLTAGKDITSLKGEIWKSIDIPTREAYVSNMGRLKVRSAKGEREMMIAKTQTSKNALSAQVYELGSPERKVHSIFMPRAVLLAFQGKPEWASESPAALYRSTHTVIYANGNPHDCRLANLKWIDAKKAARLQRAFDSADSRPAAASEPEPEPAAVIATPEPEWIDVQLYEGFYQINQLGDVRSLNRYIHRYGARRPQDAEMAVYLTEGEINDTLKKSYRFVRGVTLKPLRLDGEKIVQLCRDGVSNPVQVARLLIENFYPETDKSYKYTYIDGNKDNCTLQNLHVYF